MPPRFLAILGDENKAKNGVVEAYIYQAFEEKHLQLENALLYCINNNKSGFDLEVFFEQFWTQPRLKRSIDKIFEIVVYSLFEVLTTSIGTKINVYYADTAIIIGEFSDFAKKVLNLSEENKSKIFDAHFNRVGVTNAADRGLDMYANFGSVVQIKHLSLDEKLAEDVVTSITSNRIIIVCKSSEENVINSLLSQIGWRSRIQAIITIEEIIDWYNKALRGVHSDILGNKVL